MAITDASGSHMVSCCSPWTLNTTGLTNVCLEMSFRTWEAWLQTRLGDIARRASLFIRENQIQCKGITIEWGAMCKKGIMK